MKYIIDKRNEFLKVYKNDEQVLTKPYFPVKNEQGCWMGRIVVFEEEKELLVPFVKIRPLMHNSPNIVAEFQL